MNHQPGWTQSHDVTSGTCCRKSARVDAPLFLHHTGLYHVLTICVFHLVVSAKKDGRDFLCKWYDTTVIYFCISYVIISRVLYVNVRCYVLFTYTCFSQSKTTHCPYIKPVCPGFTVFIKIWGKIRDGLQCMIKKYNLRWLFCLEATIVWPGRPCILPLSFRIIVYWTCNLADCRMAPIKCIEEST